MEINSSRYLLCVEKIRANSEHTIGHERLLLPHCHGKRLATHPSPAKQGQEKGKTTN